jgi:RNA polymerase sigma factor (sigma-70 family)
MTARWPIADTPTPAENRELIRRYRDGDDSARDECVRRNAPLVVSMATGLQASWKFGIDCHDKEDLIQEGLIGLSEAISRFDLARDVRLSTYAYPWVRKAMIRWLYQHSRTVRVPSYLQYRGAERHGDMLRRAGHALAPHLSIHDVHPDSGLGFDDSIPAREDGEPPEDMGEKVRSVRAAIDARLDDRQREVLTRRVYSRHTLAMIGADLGLTRERVRQIERTSIDRLRRALLGREVAR